MLNKPALSVLMPVYNANKYLDESITSIINQSFSDFEFIIIDDGSTDGSLEKIKKYAGIDGRILYKTRENKGLVETHNEMLSMSHGQYIARMDADDISYPDRFERQINFLKYNDDIVAVSGSYDLIDARGRFLTRLHLPEKDREIQKLNLSGHTSLCHSCSMIRTESINKISGYSQNCNFAEDLDLWLRLGEVGKLANLPSPLLKVRLHKSSISESRWQEQQRDTLRACKLAWERRGIKGTFDATEHWRPTTSLASQHHFMIKYGWWAYNSRQRQTAVIYALKAIKFSPWKSSGWWLLLVSITKPFPSTLKSMK